MPKLGKRRVSIWLDPQLLRELKAEALRRDMALSDLVEQCLLSRVVRIFDSSRKPIGSVEPNPSTPGAATK